MTSEDQLTPLPDDAPTARAWPVVSARAIAIAEWDYDLAYMGVYLRLEICNRSPYLVREAELRVDGRGQKTQRIVASRELRVGPLFPGEYHHEEVGIGDPAGIGGVQFEYLAAHAVQLTPPGDMLPTDRYPGLTAEVVSVSEDDDTPDLRQPAEAPPGELPTTPGISIRIRVRNDGPRVVERVRLKLKYFEAVGRAPTQPGSDAPEPVAEWILDMPRADWNPYRLPAAPAAACDAADPLPPGGAHEFTLVHYNGGPYDWGRRLDATSVEVCELRLRAHEPRQDAVEGHRARIYPEEP